MAGVVHDIIEQEGEELDFNKAFDAVMSLYGHFGVVRYEFLFAMTKMEKRAYRFNVSGENVKKVEG